MKPGQSRQSQRRNRLAKALRDNLKKRKAKTGTERPVQPKDKKPEMQIKD
jgi:hypothetical protein